MKVNRLPTSVSSGRRPTKPAEAGHGHPVVPLKMPRGARGSASAADYIAIRVDHLAAPQGSHRQGFGKSVKETNPRTEPYRQAVAKACEDWIEEHGGEDDWVPWDEPVEAELTFWLMPPPKSDPNRAYPTTAPDLDKLIRSTCDGITRGRIWKDDARVVSITAIKQHADSEQTTGVDIVVRRMS